MDQDTIMREKRQTPRRRVAYRMDVSDRSRGMVGCLLDLSSSGMRVLCSPGMDIVHADRLRIEFPRWLELGAGLEVKGRFVWCKACADGYGTEAGFAFDTFSKKERALLEVLIAKIADANQDDEAA